MKKFLYSSSWQIGIANYLKSENIYEEIPLFFQQKRDFFRTLLMETKFKLLPCKGSYFQCVSYAETSDEKDTAFATRLITEFGVASIPVSAFYTKNNDDNILRFCFAKEQDTLEKAVQRLMKL